MSAHEGREVIYLDVDDDITTAIDKLESAKDKAVSLVLPKRFATLQSIVNMRLLARAAKNAKKDLAVVTSESALLPLAGAAGIAVAKSLDDTPAVPDSPVMPAVAGAAVAAAASEEVAETSSLDEIRDRDDLAPASADEDESIPIEDDNGEETAPKSPKKPKDKKLKVPDFDRFRLLLFGGIAAFVLFIIFLIMAIFVWPKATITLKTEAEPITANFDMTATDKATTLNPASGVIPAVLKTSDQTTNQSVQATGQQNNGQKAAGNIVINGGACGPSFPSDVPAGSGVTSSSGLYYTTNQTASFTTVNSGGHCNFQSNSVGITATKAGANYNGQTNFTVSGYSASGSATAGGTDNIVTILSQSDVDAVKNKISDQDKAKFADDFKKQLDKEGYYQISQTFKSGDPAISSSPSVGQPASSANVTVKITYSVLAVQKSDLKTVVKGQLTKEIDKSKQKLSNSDVLKNLNISVQSQSSPGTAALSLVAKNDAVPVINVAAMKQQVAGQKSGDIQSVLSSYPGIKSVDVKLSPFWVSKAPKKTGHIIILEKPAGGESQLP